MGFFTKIYSDATAYAVGTDLLDGTWIQEDNLPRRVTQIGVAGGNGAWAANSFDLYYGEQLIAKDIWATGNTAYGTISANDLTTISSKKVCRPGEPIRLIVRTAAWDCNTGDDDGMVILNVKDIVRRRGRWRRR